MRRPRPQPGSEVSLELADIQGNILTAYGKSGFPKGRALLLNIGDEQAGRAVIRALQPRVTTAVRWPSRTHQTHGKTVIERPLVTLNLAFTFWGLVALGVPIRTLRGMPDEFIDGMSRRAVILGDHLCGALNECWDPVWRDQGDGGAPERAVHVLVTLNAQMDPSTGEAVGGLDALTDDIEALCAATEGRVRILAGHGRSGARWQEMSALLARAPDGFVPTPGEHFGFVDAISDPVFHGQLSPADVPDRVKGNGKLRPTKANPFSWEPLATGEFLLGHVDEAQEVAGGAMPLAFSRNGTFTAFRKLQQNVKAFDDYVTLEAEKLCRFWNLPDVAAGRELLRAKLVGRWSNGVPLSRAPDYDSWRGYHPDPTTEEGRKTLSDFAYFDDPEGAKCPLGAHTRRTNPRDGSGPLFDTTRPAATGTALNDRRRLLRRGLPYGPCSAEAPSEDDERGIIMMPVCASLFRQFEFVQQQWINYGAVARAGNNPDPLIGYHGDGCNFVIPLSPDEEKAPYTAAHLPQFVEIKGGAYFFIPSITALRMIGQGMIDPT